MDIPLVIPSFNQLTFLRNLINWYRFYYPNNTILVLDNASSYQPLLEYYSQIDGKNNIRVIRFQYNSGKSNLALIMLEVLEKSCEYYIVSDPDIMPHPSTPMNFLDIFRHCIDNFGYNPVGFSLKVDDIPAYVEDKEMIIEHESIFWQNPIEIIYEGQRYQGYKAAIDSTFALYKSGIISRNDNKNSDWINSLRILEAFHLGWYIDPHKINNEMDFYFKTSNFRTYHNPHTLYNNYRPNKYKPEKGNLTK